jgi:hypothetical protein
MTTMVAQDLADARESLAYWEERAHHLPRRAIRRRREARDMTIRWRARVAEAERAVYGRGLLGALFMLAAERRLPLATRRAGRQAIRRAAGIAAAVSVALVALMVVGLATLVALVDAVV